MAAKKTKTQKTFEAMAKPVTYPMKLLRPVGDFLAAQLKSLEKRKQELDADDPFFNIDRVNDNASPDADAEEQDGHARISAMREQIDRKIIQTRRAMTRIKLGQYGLCEECGGMINTERLMIYPEATHCIKCEAKKEKSELTDS